MAADNFSTLLCAASAFIPIQAGWFPDTKLPYILNHHTPIKRICLFLSLSKRNPKPSVSITCKYKHPNLGALNSAVSAVACTCAEEQMWCVDRRGASGVQSSPASWESGKSWPHLGAWILNPVLFLQERYPGLLPVPHWTLKFSTNGK